jgi:hypothetical protein
MTDKKHGPKIAALEGLQTTLDLHRRAEAAACARAVPERLRRRLSIDVRLLRSGVQRLALGLARLPRDPLWRNLLRRATALARRPRLRRIALAGGAVMAALTIAVGLLWWRLMSGPISLDLATPWLASAIEQNFGTSHRVEVGGTVLERDEHGRTALRIRDIKVRDLDGAIVASAPRAEVGLSGWSLLSGQLRAQSLNLVGAEISVRIEPDGQVTVFAGADKRPLATAPAPAAAKPLTPTAPGGRGENAGASTNASPGAGTDANHLAALLAWIDSLGALGLDGYDLAEIGLKNGNLVVDDQRTGKQFSFQNINLSLTRPNAGEVAFSVGSDNREKPWVLMATVRPSSDGRRLVGVEARRVSLRDVMLALRMGEDQYEADLPVSLSLRAEIDRNGLPQFASGRLLAGPGNIVDTHDPDGSIAIDRAEFTLDWDAARRALAIPFQIVSGGNRITLVAQAEAPREAGAPWSLGLTGGSVVLAPLTSDDDPLLINRIMLRGSFDPAKRRIELEHGDIGGKGVGIALSGGVDFSGSDPRIGIGVAGREMSASVFKRIWPVFIATPVRSWVLEHLLSGKVERLEIATNAPYSTLKQGGPPIPDDGLSVQIVSSGTAIRPVESLPTIRDANLLVDIKGRTATVTFGNGAAEMSAGRKLAVSNGAFEIADTQIKPPQARVRLKIDGPVPAVAELLSLDRLRDASGSPLDPGSSRGNVSAQVALALPIDPDLPKGVVKYTVNADVTNFAVDRFMMAQKVEAATLHVLANNDGYVAKGDIRIGGTPASVEYRKPHGDGDAEVRFQGTFDDAARARLGYDLYGAVTGPIPIKLNGRVGSSDEDENRFAVEADLTQARIDNLLPGWAKPAGKSARAAFTLITKGKTSRLEDLALDGSGAQVRGTVEVESDGDIQSANFPVFGLADGDKASLKVERGSDGALKVTMRGDVYDGRGFVKSSLGGGTSESKSKPIGDLDLDIKLGAVTGFHGEALRGLDLHLSRRAGRIRVFSMNAKLGRDTPLIGDLRGGTGRNARQVVYFETNDAGALFRFTDTYPKIVGGQMWVAMDPPTENQTPQDGLLNIRDFSVRGEAALDRVASSGEGNGRGGGVEFSRMRVDFTRSPGKLTIRDGVVRGPVIGATIDGVIDYAANDVRLRGTFVPLYGLNNAFGQIPIVGLFLGGEKEGLVGITYEVVGPPGNSTLRVNPISAVAPGFLRKFFEFPSAGQRGFSEQSRGFSDPNR